MGEVESSEEIAASTWPDFWEIASACAQNFLRMLGAIGIDLFAPNDLSLCFFSVRPSDHGPRKMSAAARARISADRLRSLSESR